MNLKPVLDIFSNEYDNLFKVDTSKNSDFIQNTLSTNTPVKFIPFMIIFENGVVKKIFNNNITLENLKKLL